MPEKKTLTTKQMQEGLKRMGERAAEKKKRYTSWTPAKKVKKTNHRTTEVMKELL